MGQWRSRSMAQASWSAPTRMVFLLHGEDPFRTRLRVGELVESLLAGGTGEPGDLSQRRSPQLGGAPGLARVDARSGPGGALTLGRPSPGPLAAGGEGPGGVAGPPPAPPRRGGLPAFPPGAPLRP